MSVEVLIAALSPVVVGLVGLVVHHFVVKSRCNVEVSTVE